MINGMLDKYTGAKGVFVDQASTTLPIPRISTVSPP